MVLQTRAVRDRIDRLIEFYISRRSGRGASPALTEKAFNPLLSGRGFAST
jgi:hypothetical protein